MTTKDAEGFWGKHTANDLRALADAMDDLEAHLHALDQIPGCEPLKYVTQQEALRIGKKFAAPFTQINRLVRDSRDAIMALMTTPPQTVKGCQVDMNRSYLTRQTNRIRGRWDWRLHRTITNVVRLNNKKRNGVFYWVGFVVGDDPDLPQGTGLLVKATTKTTDVPHEWTVA